MSLLTSTNLGYRTRCLAEITSSNKVWDLVVIGGGATGLGIALEATLRGISTLLVEQADFAKGTSSRSTKLVHGGVRYLANGELKLVREASVERGRLQHNAPHLVKDQIFIIPVYSFLQRIKYTIGLKLYDWIAGKLLLRSSRFISRKETLQQLLGIESSNLVGGVLYHDGQFDDARLALNLAQTIWDNKGFAINYFSVTGLLKNEQQKVAGIYAKDIETGSNYSIQAKAVVNATGVFADDILTMDNLVHEKILSVSQGIHLVLDTTFFPSSHALMIPKTSDGRVLFAVPWHNKLVVGTTDTPVEIASLEPQALEKEINFILETAAQYLLKKPTRSDVLSVFTGLRPLASNQSGTQKTKEISRSHKIIVSASGLFTMIGGKWTTYRKMGEDMVNRIEKDLQWTRTNTQTKNFLIHGSMDTQNWKDPLYVYGSDGSALKKTLNETGAVLISEPLQIYEAQVIWAVEHEMARTVEDVLSRRTRALFLDAKESIRIAQPVAVLMANILHKDAHWIKNQVDDFNLVAKHYLLN